MRHVRRAVQPLVHVPLLAGIVAAIFYSGAAHVPTQAPHVVTKTDTAPTRPVCDKPAPASATDYTNMFAGVDQRQFGAADVGASVKLADGRVVWLFGDTFSTGRFVHSTAIVQHGGCLTVAGGGGQLLPNDDANHIYWIAGGTAHGNTVKVKARTVTLTGKGPWDFKDGGSWRYANVRVTDTNQAVFVGWASSKIKSPSPNPGTLTMIGPGHFTYAHTNHPDLPLASGKTLHTAAQNWDDGKMHPMSDYRLIFTEVSR